VLEFYRLTVDKNKKGVVLPKIVDKEQKRLEIANCSKELLLQKGFAKLTVSEVAKNAGIGKGTIYQYFSSKDDIVFAIIDAYIADELQKLDSELEKLPCFEQKIYRYFDFILSVAQPMRQKQIKSYLEYLSVAIVSSDEAMCRFNQECKHRFKSRLRAIIENAVAAKEVKACAIDMLDGLYALEKGFVLMYATEKDASVDVQMRAFLDTLVNLVRLGDDR
jgi:AcrR family transcriptional regulator